MSLLRLAGPLASGLTYRRYVHLLLGAVLLLPYLVLVWLFTNSVAGGLDPVALVLLLVPATAGAVAVALVTGVRALEVTAARALLDADVADPDPASAGSWPGRRRAAWWLLVNMGLGGLAALLTLTVVPSAIGFLIAPWRAFPPLPTGLAGAWEPVVGLALPPILLHAVAAAGGWPARLAPRLLGPTPEERLAAELEKPRSEPRSSAISGGLRLTARDRPEHERRPGHPERRPAALSGRQARRGEGAADHGSILVSIAPVRLSLLQ